MKDRNGNIVKWSRPLKIYFSTRRGEYIICKGTRHYFDEFMRYDFMSDIKNDKEKEELREIYIAGGIKGITNSCVMLLMVVRGNFDDVARVAYVY